MRAEPAFLGDVGEKYHDFSLKKLLKIEELKCVLREIVHEPSGAQIMHIHNDDPENLFCLSFKTLPSSSNGVAHILEHTVLCGSRKFPIKDPFFAMTRRSLNTFMNALTGSDFTCYPAASMVEKDFYNLLEVYLDAVFHPELKELSFRQEGHRLEFADPKNPNTPLEFKGIVYNEMKGSLSSSADTRLWHAMMENLCPDLPYAFNSGGDPKFIPNLTYEELLSFHEYYYHPSRCLFFFYGNLPLKKHLDFIAEKTLKNVLPASPLPPIPRQPRFSSSVLKEMRYPINEGEEMESKTMVAFGWLTAPLIEQEDVLALSVLDSILMDTDASLLKRSFLASGLCIQADAFMDTEMSEVPYVIVCKGCKKENVEELEKVLRVSLKEIIEKGIPFDLIDTAIHQLEIARTEITGDYAPFGLTLFMRSALAKQHNCAPELALTVHALFEELLTRVKNPEYLPGILEKYLLNNSHFVRLVLHPDPTLTSEEIEEERKILNKIQENLTPFEKEKIVKQAEELAHYQHDIEKQNLACLPKIGLDDVPLTVHDFHLKQETVHSLHVFRHECFTNYILYADLVFDLPYLSLEELPYAQLLIALLPEIGAGKRDYVENLRYIQSHTGGVSASLQLHLQVESPGKSKPCVMIRGKALNRKKDKLFSLLYDMAISPRYNDKKRIEELILQLNSSLHNRFNRNAIRYAAQLALSGFSTPSFIGNLWHGLPFFQLVEKCAKEIKSHPNKVIEKLLSLKEKLFSLKSPHLILCCDETVYPELSEHQFYELSKLPIKTSLPWNEEYALPHVTSQARPISSPVAFNVEAFRSVPLIHPHSAALNAAAHLFDNKVLHRLIREQGGAYGCGTSYSSTSGNIYFQSYRDPHIASTLKSFQVAVDEIAAGRFDDRDLEEAKLEVIQGMDVPLSPGNRAIVAYGWQREGKTKEIRQHFRNRLLTLTKKEILQAVEKDIIPRKSSSTIVSFASKELLEKENKELEKMDKALPILPLP